MKKNNKYEKTIALITIFTLCVINGFSQDSIRVSGHFVGNTKYAKVLMKKFDVGNFIVGGATIKDEKFSLTLPPDVPAGVYRFVHSTAEGEQYVDVIINGKEKEISYTLKANEEQALPVFNVSEENKLWYAYLEQNRAQLDRVSLLTQFINAYPNRGSNVYQAATQEWEEEKNLYFSNLEKYKSQTQGTWAYEMVANRPYYFADPKEDFRIQDYMKREHFWDGFNANNPNLINSPLYTEHTLNFLRYWMNPNMNFSAEEKTNGFKRSVDVIMRQFAGNEQTHEFAFKYLSIGFKEIGEEEVLQYLDENYKDLANRCYDDFEKTEFDKRMQGYATIKVGNTAPNFALNMANNKAASLYKLKAEKTIVVFWSSTCPHCLEEIPKLNEWAATQKNLKVIAVSLDTDKTVYEETIKKFPSLIHTCDYKGWNTEAATKYYIAATPTFIVLDKSKKIIGKFSSWQQVVK